MINYRNSRNLNGVQPFERMFRMVRDLGGTIPAQFTAVLATRAAYGEALTSRATAKQPIENFVAAAESGVGLSAEAAREHLMSAAKARFITQHGLNLNLNIELGQLMHTLLMGNAGDEMFASLRPILKEAIEGVEAAAAAGVGPETTTDQLVDMPVEAIAAFQAVKQQHAPLLDRVLEMLRFATRPVELEVFPPHLVTAFGPYLLAAWFAPADKSLTAPDIAEATAADPLAEVGSILNRSLAYWGNNPGGRWLQINQAFGLRLNSPREAVAVLQPLYELRAADDEARYGLGRRAQQAQQVTPATDSSVTREQPRGGVMVEDAETIPVQTLMDDGFSEDVN
jgi:hypothetical protein